MKALFSLFVALAVLFSLSLSVSGQGITSGTLSGIVLDQNGQPLVGATINALHVPSGTAYGTVSRQNGFFTLANMRIGDTYTLFVYLLGFKDFLRSDVKVQLGDNRPIRVQLEEKPEELEQITVTAKQLVPGAEQSGISTFISGEMINNLPTIDRSLQDFLKLVPQNSGGLSFGGRNNYYNNLSIDGSVFNNAFGLETLPGGQPGAQPISLDAIAAIGVSLYCPMMLGKGVLREPISRP